MWVDHLKDIWKGETAVVLGGGPSVAEYVKAPLNVPTIAINYMHRLYPQADYSLVVKEYIYRDVVLEREPHKLVVPCYGGFKAPDTYQWLPSPFAYLAEKPEPNTLYSDIGSGAAPAACLAALMGAKHIILVGVDFGFCGVDYYAKGYRADHTGFIPSGRRMDAESTERAFQDGAKTMAIIREGFAKRGIQMSYLSPYHWRERENRPV